MTRAGANDRSIVAPCDEAPATGVVHVIDHDPYARDAIRVLLEKAGYAVRAHASPKSLLRLASPGEAGCVVADLAAPDSKSLELLIELQRRRHALRLVAIVDEKDVALAVRAMKMGASDVVEKPLDAETLLAAVRAALAIGRDRNAHHAEWRLLRDRRATLSAREGQVLLGLLRGLSNKEICAELGLSVRTVEAHRARIMTKMSAINLPHLLHLSCIAACDFDQASPMGTNSAVAKSRNPD